MMKQVAAVNDFLFLRLIPGENAAHRQDKKSSLSFSTSFIPSISD